jgi:ribosomal-protein-alanine N-acetyltransferase
MQRYLKGKRISLHGLSPADLRADGPYYSWLDDLSLDLFGERSDFPNNTQRMESYYAAACANDRLLLLGIFDNVSGQHIGNITLQQIDWIHRRAFLGYLIGDKAFAGKGIASEACLMILQYGFNKLNLERIWTTVALEHEASMRVAAKAGFQQEGQLRAHQLRNGKRRDMAVFGCLREEWVVSHAVHARALFSEPSV